MRETTPFPKGREVQLMPEFLGVKGEMRVLISLGLVKGRCLLRREKFLQIELENRLQSNPVLLVPVLNLKNPKLFIVLVVVRKFFSVQSDVVDVPGSEFTGDIRDIVLIVPP